VVQVTEETSSMRFNTGIAAMMEFVNGAYKWEQRPRQALEQFVLLLAPYAPHLAEEMWQVPPLYLAMYLSLHNVMDQQLSRIQRRQNLNRNAIS